ncbi:hypothetical protein AVEN_140565-1, partial [Araneus ventricosus]
MVAKKFDNEILINKYALDRAAVRSLLWALSAPGSKPDPTEDPLRYGSVIVRYSNFPPL